MMGMMEPTLLIRIWQSIKHAVRHIPSHPLPSAVAVNISPFLQIYNTPLVQSPESVSSGSHYRFKLLDKQILVLLIPTLFDLFGSALLNIGLLAVTASATAMLRQSLLPFAALLGVGLFRKQLNRLHVLGLSGCLVSCSELLKVTPCSSACIELFVSCWSFR